MSKIIDLEEIVQTWAWNTFKKAKSSKSKLDKLENAFLDINWSRVNFTPKKPKFDDAKPSSTIDGKDEPSSKTDGKDEASSKIDGEVEPSSKIDGEVEPSSKTIFKSVFKNDSDITQNHTLKIERQTTATCTSSLTKGCSKGFNIGITLAAPAGVAEASVGFEKGFTVENAIESTDEKTLTWATEGSLAVPRKSVLTAELQIKEKQSSFTFKTTVAVSGKITVSIYDRTDNSNFVMSVSGDIADVILKTPNLKEVTEGDNAAFFHMEGICTFRFGIEQEIKCY